MRVPTHGAVLDGSEDEALERVIKRRWYTAGEECTAFERALREYTGKREVVLCNSGSSANLLAIMALTADELDYRQLRPGFEVITTALNFPTTITPIIQAGVVPVFVDVNLPGMDANMEAIEAAITAKTKAIILAHTLGFPIDTRRVRELCNQHGIWMIEDCCDALGSPNTVSLADMATLSFYPAHQITTGEGGAVLTGNPKLAKILRSYRDWGRDCWCAPGEDNVCGIRFSGYYDHKYTYSHIGYHLAMTDMQGALGVAQMAKLPRFVEQRRENHAYLSARAREAGLDEWFILPPDCDASWFGFCLICKPPLERKLVIRWLEAHDIQTRLVFGGNLLRQPAFSHLNAPVIGGLDNTNIVHDNAFWVGCWPGLTREQMDWFLNSVIEYCVYVGMPHD